LGEKEKEINVPLCPGKEGSSEKKKNGGSLAGVKTGKLFPDRYAEEKVRGSSLQEGRKNFLSFALIGFYGRGGKEGGLVFSFFQEGRKRKEKEGDRGTLSILVRQRKCGVKKKGGR